MLLPQMPRLQLWSYRSTPRRGGPKNRISWGTFTHTLPGPLAWYLPSDDQIAGSLLLVALIRA